MKTLLDEPCLLADLEMLSAIESGNLSPVYSGWRPLLRYDADPEKTVFGSNTVVLNVEKLEPAQVDRVIIRILQTTLTMHAELACPGATFKLMDGNRNRAVGTVVEFAGRCIIESNPKPETRQMVGYSRAEPNTNSQEELK